MTQFCLQDLMVLYEYFAAHKKNPTEEDARRMVKIDEIICRLVDSMVSPETFEKLKEQGTITDTRN